MTIRSPVLEAPERDQNAVKIETASVVLSKLIVAILVIGRNRKDCFLNLPGLTLYLIKP